MGIEEDFITGCEADLIHSDDDGQDSTAHEKLLRDVASLSSKKRSKNAALRTEPAARVSEFGFNSASEGKVRLYELVGSLDRSVKSGKMKKQLGRVEKRQKVVQTPLSKPELEKIHRVVGYEVTSKEVSKWDPVVKQNRRAKQVYYPLNQSDMRMMESTAELADSHKPRTELELQIAALLKENRDVLPDKRALSEAELEALKAVSLEEAAQRRAALQKQRALLSYYGAKLKRQGKIKSKNYHRIKRKAEKKKEEKKLEGMKESDIEGYQQAVRKVEQQRIQERMSLKHKGTSQFMKKQMTYGKYDPDVRQSVQTMLQLGEELRKKSAVSLDSDDDDESDTSSVNDAPVSATTSNNPWMSAKLAKPSKPTTTPVVEVNDVVTEKSATLQSGIITRTDDDDDDDFDVDELFNDAKRAKKDSSSTEAVGDGIKKKRKNNKKNKKQKDEKEKSSPTKSPVKKKVKGNQLSDPILVTESDSDVEPDDDDEQDDDVYGSDNDLIEDVPDVEVRPGKKRKRSKKKNKSVTPTEPEPKPVMLDPRLCADIVISHALPIQSEEHVTTAKTVEEMKQVTLFEAFADDKVVEEFLIEKQQVEERDKPKDIDLTLPGWGEWTGPGVIASQGKKKRFIIKAPDGPPRKDRNLPDVIISERKDESIAKLQVSSLPFPYRNVQDYQKSISKPIGADVNPISTFKKTIKPKTVIRMGAVIEPISKAETFNNKKKPKWDLAVKSDRGNDEKLKGEGGKSDKKPRNKNHRRTYKK